MWTKREMNATLKPDVVPNFVLVWEQKMTTYTAKNIKAEGSVILPGRKIVGPFEEAEIEAIDHEFLEAVENGHLKDVITLSTSHEDNDDLESLVVDVVPANNNGVAAASGPLISPNNTYDADEAADVNAANTFHVELLETVANALRSLGIRLADLESDASHRRAWYPNAYEDLPFPVTYKLSHDFSDDLWTDYGILIPHGKTVETHFLGPKMIEAIIAGTINCDIETESSDATEWILGSEETTSEVETNDTDISAMGTAFNQVTFIDNVAVIVNFMRANQRYLTSLYIRASILAKHVPNTLLVIPRFEQYTVTKNQKHYQTPLLDVGELRDLIKGDIEVSGRGPISLGESGTGYGDIASFPNIQTLWGRSEVLADNNTYNIGTIPNIGNSWPGDAQTVYDRLSTWTQVTLVHPLVYLTQQITTIEQYLSIKRA